MERCFQLKSRILGAFVGEGPGEIDLFKGDIVLKLGDTQKPHENWFLPCWPARLLVKERDESFGLSLSENEICVMDTKDRAVFAPIPCPSPKLFLERINKKVKEGIDLYSQSYISNAKEFGFSCKPVYSLDHIFLSDKEQKVEIVLSMDPQGDTLPLPDQAFFSYILNLSEENIRPDQDPSYLISVVVEEGGKRLFSWDKNSIKHSKENPGWILPELIERRCDSSKGPK